MKNRGPASIPGGALLDETVPQGTLFQRFVNVPKGEYYLVIDNSDRAGHSAAADREVRRPRGQGRPTSCCAETGQQ